MIEFDRARIESLSDGVYAVAITLLVLELKMPEIPAGATDAVFVEQLALVWPKLLSWLISFVFLSFFWFGFHRLLRQVKRLDGPFLLICLLHVMFVALSPFAIAIYGANVTRFPAQVVYNAMLSGFSITFLLLAHHAIRHPELLERPLAQGRAVALRIRFWSLLACAGISTLIASVDIRYFGVGYAPLFLTGFLARRLERRIDGVSRHAERP